MALTIDNPTDLDDLMVIMRRPEIGGPLRGVAAPSGDLRRGLSLRPEALDETLLRLGEIAALLPDEGLTPEQKAKARKLSYAEQGTVLRNFAAGLRRFARVTGGGPDPAVLESLARMLTLYAAIRRQAATGVSRGMDLRLLLGAFQFYLLRLVLQVVVRRLEDPKTPGGERTRLQNAFAGLLLHKEQLLLSTEQTRELLRTRREEMKARFAEEERLTQIRDVAHAVRRNLPLDQETVEEAALAYAEELERRKTGR